MKKVNLVITLIFLFFLTNIASAGSISLQRYFNASCQDYTGTWNGFITDPTDLFGNGGAWPVTVYLYEKNGHIIGRSDSVTYGKKEGVITAKKIWANCSDGNLSQIIWGEKGECGGVSQQGMLVSKNTMILQLDWESAMTGTTFVAFLQRVNTKYPYATPTKEEDFLYGKRETCH